jgi:hypothetical protein
MLSGRMHRSEHKYTELTLRANYPKIECKTIEYIPYVSGLKFTTNV